MEAPKKKPGPKPKRPGEKKKAYSLSLSEPQISNLEAQAAAADCNTSELVIQKLRLNAIPKPKALN